MDSLLDSYSEVRECDYKGEHYSVRDNGAVMPPESITLHIEKIPNTRAPYHVTFLVKVDASKLVAELAA